MSQIHFIGDIHGRVEAVEAALKLSGRKIFVGDFVDSFDRSVKDQVRCLHLILDAIDSGEAEAVFGNHELSYISRLRCSGWNIAMDAQINHGGLWRELVDKFKPYVLIEPEGQIERPILVTHAGFSNFIFETFHLTLENFRDNLRDWTRPDLLFEGTPAYHIGRTRGGNAAVGGIYWCHFPHEFVPVPGLDQVFGHTRQSDGTIKKMGICDDSQIISENYCIDILEDYKGFKPIEKLVLTINT